MHEALDFARKHVMALTQPIIENSYQSDLEHNQVVNDQTNQTIAALALLADGSRAFAL